MLVTVSDLVTYMDISFSLRQQDAAEIVLSGLQSELETYLRRPIEVQEFTETYTVPGHNRATPMSAFFYRTSYESSFYNASGSSLPSSVNYAMPPETIYFQNSPVSSVKQVSLSNAFTNPILLGESARKTRAITNAVKSGTEITFTAPGHSFTVGQFVTITDAAPTEYNIRNKQIVEVEGNTFVVDVGAESFSAYTSGGTALAEGHNYVVRKYGIDIFGLLADDVINVTYEAGLDGESIPVFKLLILRAATREMQNMHDDVVGIKDLNSRNVAPLETGFSERELMSVKKYRRVRVA